MFKIPKKKNKDEPENTNREHGGNRTKKHPVGLPYTKGLSEELQWIFKSHGVPTYHKPSCTLRQMLVYPKDKNKKEQQCGIVYEITCEDCKEKYVGETARTLGTRLKEHTTTKGQVTSATAEPMKDSGHRIKMDNVKVIGRENNNHRGKIKEAIQIYKRHPALKRNQGMEIPAITLKLLSCGPTGSHDE